jgi:nicotinamidase-related amidase
MSSTPGTSWPGPVDEHIAPRLATSALLIIDTQVDFVDGGRSPIPGTTAVIPRLVELRSAFLDAGRPVVHVVRLYAGDDVDRLRRTAMASGAHIVAPGSDGSQVVPELRVAGQRTPDHERLLAGEIEQLDGNEWAIWKPRWSAFHRTRLHRHLADLSVDTIVVAGCNFPNCPRATIYDGSELDYRVLVPVDAVSGIEEWHISELAKIGVLTTGTADLLPALSSAASVVRPRARPS